MLSGDQSPPPLQLHIEHDMVDNPHPHRALPATPVRLAAYGLIAAFSLHFIMPLLPVSPTMLRWVEAIVGFMALSWLTSLLYNDYRRGGMLLSSAREELLLVGAFGLFWLAVAAIFRAWHRGQSPVIAAEQALFGIPAAPAVPAAQPNAVGGLSAANPAHAQAQQLMNAIPTYVSQAMGTPVRTRVTYVVEEVYQQYW